MQHTNLSPIKPDALPKLAGVSIALDIEDNRIRGLTLTDAEGATLTIRHQDYSGLRLLAPVPPVERERFRLHGTAAGVAIDQTFDAVREAEQAKRMLESGDGENALTIEPLTVTEPAPLVAQ